MLALASLLLIYTTIVVRNYSRDKSPGAGSLMITYMHCQSRYSLNLVLPVGGAASRSK